MDIQRVRIFKADSSKITFLKATCFSIKCLTTAHLTGPKIKSISLNILRYKTKISPFKQYFLKIMEGKWFSHKSSLKRWIYFFSLWISVTVCIFLNPSNMIWGVILIFYLIVLFTHFLWLIYFSLRILPYNLWTLCKRVTCK